MGTPTYMAPELFSGGRAEPGMRVAHAREVARAETFDRLAHEFTDERRAGWTGCW